MPPPTDVAFLLADVSELQSGPVVQEDKPKRSAMIETRLQHGRSCHFDGAMDAAILARLIRAVQTA